MTIVIKGNWRKGIAYDLHSFRSVYLGVDENGNDRWETTRSQMGDLLYQLKYQSDRTAIGKIVDLLAEYEKLGVVDAIVPVPSTNKSRLIQPVDEIARELGKRIDVPVFEDVLEKQPGGRELKNVNAPDERKALLKKQMTLTGRHDLTGKSILLLDDLYRSGATLTVATDILYLQAKVKDVFVLTMTKARRRR